MRPEDAQSAFILGTHLAGQGDFEAARGALLSCLSAGDPEWSPRAAEMLGEMLWDRGDPELMSLTGQALTVEALAARYAVDVSG